MKGKENLLPRIVRTLRCFLAASADWVDVRVKSPSIDWPVLEPTLARNTSMGSAGMQSSCQSNI